MVSGPTSRPVGRSKKKKKKKMTKAIYAWVHYRIQAFESLEAFKM